MNFSTGRNLSLEYRDGYGNHGIDAWFHDSSENGCVILENEMIAKGPDNSMKCYQRRL